MNPIKVSLVENRNLAAIEEQLKKINQTLRVMIQPDSLRLEFKVGPVTNKERKNKMLEITITNEQKVNVTLHPVTATGRPAQVDGAPTWEVVTGNSTVVPAVDGLSADLISSDDPGDTDFLVKADADLGSGVVEISDVIRLSVAGAQAANLGLVAGDPTPK